MANWYKISGVVLIILGVVIILGSSIVLVPVMPSGEGHPWDIDATGFYVGFGLGLVLIVLGILLYYFGHRRERKEGSAPLSRPRN